MSADEGQHLQTVYPAAKEYGGPGRFGLAPDSHLTETSPLVSKENARKLFDEWSEHWTCPAGARREVTPEPAQNTFLQALFPSSSFVIIVRHPIPASIPTARWRRTRRYDRMFEHWLHCHELFEADREHLERVHVLAYEQLVRDPAGVLRGIFEFLGLEPIGPSEPVEGGANEKYFRQWREMKHDLRMRAYLDLVSLRYERRVRHYGYSLLSPERSYD